MFRTTVIGASLLLTTAALAQAPAGHRVKVNGMQMYYEVSGKGDPIIVLHGAYMNIPTMAERMGARHGPSEMFFD